jgi:uncharacterized protein DUF6166
MKQYVGRRNPDGMCTVLVVDGKDRWPLPLRLDLANHSPTGFEWGYGGSGPAQLSLALLADALQDDRQAMLLHQEYKFRVIGRLPRPGFTLEADEIAKTASELWIEQDD